MTLVTPPLFNRVTVLYSDDMHLNFCSVIILIDRRQAMNDTRLKIQ